MPDDISRLDVSFRPLDRTAEINITERNLPHWFQSGVAIFVTIRTADSLPREVLLSWQLELEEWLRLHKLPLALARLSIERKQKLVTQLLNTLSIQQRRDFKRLNSRIWHRSLDECHGKCLLRKPPLAQIVADAVLPFEGTRYHLDSFVIMPNHLHAMVQFINPADLTTVSQRWMRFTARSINAATGSKGAFWQPEPFDHIIRSGEQFTYLQRYTADNPERANLQPGEYLYWSRATM